MAKKEKGIVVDIGGDVSKLGKAIKEIDGNTRKLQKELKGVETLLKFDPENTVLLSQKQDILNASIEETRKKLDLLKSSQDDVNKAFQEGDISEEQYRDFQRELIFTEKRLGEFEQALEDADKPADELAESVDEVGDSAEDAGKETLKLGDIIKANLISEAIIGGVKALGAAMKGMIKGIVDIGKQSIESFAEMEQLIGGVDTLFGKSSKKVQEFANDAYKTAGLGANEYMEQITAFSASLLQSLGGDTDKAAEVGNMAMVDMADNANKMGTAIGDIQNAYQGFAKQNYTMLDNLKLGYGGTKTEMERLLKDAQKLSGVKYDISNLNDVFQAIHVVQTEIGITGTTALEAEETISGSVNAMKSSWSNFITGLSNDNANLTQLSNNLIQSALTVLDNILPVIKTFADSLIAVIPQLITSIIEYLPQLIDTGIQLVGSLGAGIMESIPTITPIIMDLLLLIVTTIIEQLPNIIVMGIDILMSLINGLIEAMPELIPIVIDAILLIVETLIDNIDKIVDGGIMLILAIAQGLIDALPDLIAKVPVIIAALVAALIRNRAKILKAGVDLMVMLANGIIKGIPQLIAKIPQIIKQIISKFTNTNWLQVGKDIIRGIGDGIVAMAGWVVQKAKDVASGILGGIKGFFGIKSPSRVMRDQIGKMLPQGIGIGVEADTDQALNAVDDMNAKLLSASSDGMVNLMNGQSIQQTSPYDDILSSLNNNSSSRKMDQFIGVFSDFMKKMQSLQVVMDSGVLVGELKNGMDKVLGQEQDLKGRGR